MRDAPAAYDGYPDTDRGDLLLIERGGGPCRTARDIDQGVSLIPFTMAFQPIVDVSARRIVAYEALVRGPRGESAAHVLGQVNDDNMHAFDQACRVKAIELAAKLGIRCGLNINFLPTAVHEPLEGIRATLDAAARVGFPVDQVTFEIVETDAVADADHLVAIAGEYQRQGFGLALDDFGAGNSGFVRVADLRPDVVKVDRALIRGCDQDRRRLAIVGSVLDLGQRIGFKVVLEGMEREEEVAALRSVGGRFMQGFYFGRPLYEQIATCRDLF